MRATRVVSPGEPSPVPQKRPAGDEGGGGELEPGKRQGGGDNGAVLAELRALRSELESIKANTQSSAVSASKLGRVVDRVTDGGNAMLTKEL